jgi:hypothetical protein
VRAETVKFTAEEVAILKGVYDASQQYFGWQNGGIDHFKQLADNQGYAQQYREAFGKLSNDAALFAKAAAAFGNESTLSTQQLGFFANGGKSFTTIIFDKALAPGTAVSVQNSRTGARSDATLPEPAGQVLTDAQRRASVMFSDAADGDPIVVTFRDPAGNAGKPYGFILDSKSRDGKCKSNPLAIRLASLALANAAAAGA